MLRGVHKSKRPSGFQQRKARQTREQAQKQYEGSMPRFVKQSEKSPSLDDREQNQDIAEVFESTTITVFESNVTTPIAPVMFRKMVRAMHTLMTQHRFSNLLLML